MIVCGRQVLTSENPISAGNYMAVLLLFPQIDPLFFLLTPDLQPSDPEGQPEIQWDKLRKMLFPTVYT